MAPSGDGVWQINFVLKCNIYVTHAALSANYSKGHVTFATWFKTSTVMQSKEGRNSLKSLNNLRATV